MKAESTYETGDRVRWFFGVSKFTGYVERVERNRFGTTLVVISDTGVTWNLDPTLNTIEPETPTDSDWMRAIR